MKLIAILFLITAIASAQNPTPGEVEAQRCEERIAGVQRDVLGKYDEALAELQVSLQKAADLEGALAVRAERQRATSEGVLSDKHLVGEPKTLRALQVQTITKLQDLTAQLVNETVPKLIDYKKSLTIAGKLDEALAVRTALERLQNGFVPVNRADAGSLVSAETLITAYAADKARADKIYKGQRIVVRGVVGGFRQDPADTKQFLVYLAGGAGNGWVQCAFAMSDFHIREEKQFNNTTLVLTSKDRDSVTIRFAKGSPAEIRGTCEGFDEVVRLAKCDAIR